MGRSWSRDKVWSGRRRRSNRRLQISYVPLTFLPFAHPLNKSLVPVLVDGRISLVLLYLSFSVEIQTINVVRSIDGAFNWCFTDDSMLLCWIPYLINVARFIDTRHDSIPNVSAAPPGPHKLELIIR